MGLDNKPCLDPVYWCPIHQVWLSKEDAQRKGCFNKMSFDMIGPYVCPSLQEKDYETWRRKSANWSDKETEESQSRVLQKPKKKKSYEEWCQSIECC